jgi:hypothetical protein
MRTLPTAIAISIVGGAVCAQPASDGIKALETCFQLTRSADAVCDHPGNAAAERLDCLERARKAQLECIEHVRAGLSSAVPAPPATPPGTGQPEVRAGPVPPERPIATMPSEKPIPAVPTEKPIAAVPPNTPAATVTPQKPVGPASPAMPPHTNWVVSETTSPVDFSPLVAAVMRLPSGVQDAPNALTIRCRGLRTELLVRTDGRWPTTRGSEVEVGYQIDDQPLVRLPWTVSADGKSAGYKDDAGGLVRSLPEGARLKIAVLEGSGSGHEATFQLAGLDAVRRKIAAACRWPPAAEKTSSGNR